MRSGDIAIVASAIASNDSYVGGPPIKRHRPALLGRHRAALRAGRRRDVDDHDVVEQVRP